MNLNGSPRNRQNSSAGATMHRSIDDPDDSQDKRNSFSGADLDLEALVSQLNQHTGDASGHDGATLSLEEQLEGALASLQSTQPVQAHDMSAHGLPTLHTPGQHGPVDILHLPGGPESLHQAPQGYDAHAGVNAHLQQPVPSENMPTHGQQLFDEHSQAQQHGLQPQQAQPQQQQPQQQPQQHFEAAPMNPEYAALLQGQVQSEIKPLSGDSAAMSATRRRCIPVLDSLAAQLLDFLASNQYQEVLTVVTQPDTEKGHAYRLIVDLFEETKKLFSTGGPFLPYKLEGLSEYAENQQVLQRANLATFCAAVFGSIEIGFWDLNKWFLSVFVPEGNRILKTQTPILLDLKTQAYISSFNQTDRPRPEVLDELFPADIADQLASTHQDRSALTPSEQDFVSRCGKRRENIENEDDQIVLAKRYQWVYFLRDLSDYILKHHYSLIPLQKPEPRKVNATPSPAPSTAPSTKNASPAATTAGSGTEEKQPKRAPRRELGEEAKQKVAENDGKLGEASLAMYEVARASAEGIENSRSPKTGAFTRRTWSKEEEEALLKGLDRVQGPYWSQILELYGPGGSISEVLKDRTQVQLKDKARNLKMFFVRCGLPIPAVFQYVTGDYETRKSSGKRSRERRKIEDNQASKKVAQSSATEPGQPVAVNQQQLEQELQQVPKLTANAVPSNQPPHLDENTILGDMPQLDAPGPGQPLDDEQLQSQTADALDKALSLLKENDADENQLQHLIQSVGDYINNQT